MPLPERSRLALEVRKGALTPEPQAKLARLPPLGYYAMARRNVTNGRASRRKRGREQSGVRFGHLDNTARSRHRSLVLVYAVVDDSLSPTSPLGDSIDVFVRREDAERFVEEVRGDDPELAADLRIEERVLDAGGVN